MSLYKKIVLSGAITGHEDEAQIYFKEAEMIVSEKFPLAKIFNPTKLPRGIGWHTAMRVCETRICGWATDIVYIKNRYYADSKGSAIEKLKAIESRLGEYELFERELILLPPRS